MKDPVLDDLRDLKDSLGENSKSSGEVSGGTGPENPWVSKLILAISAIFLLLIVITYLMPGNFISTLQGQVASDELSEDFTVRLNNDAKVTFEGETYQDLRQIYFDNQETEIKICLLGEKRGENYFIDGIKLPLIYYKTLTSVSAEPCSSDTIVALHTHPYKRCLPSEQDLKSHQAYKKINPDALSALMCETNRFNFYGV